MKLSARILPTCQSQLLSFGFQRSELIRASGLQVVNKRRESRRDILGSDKLKLSSVNGNQILVCCCILIRIRLQNCENSSRSAQPEVDVEFRFPKSLVILYRGGRSGSEYR